MSGALTVRVLLFGPEAAAAGAPAVEVTLTGDHRCAAVPGAVARACPALAGKVAACRVAINHRFAEPDSTISGSDEVALIGLVSGG